ncbi:MAG: PucR family transcriptional regulator [Hungatella sp.]|nr:PucR family transcriptional regulator [Hungatella sp.]
MTYPPLTLGWFLNETPIDNLEFIGKEEDLQKPITGISVLDNPDGVRWIKKHEIILTTGYIFYNDVELQKQVIADLHAIECTAFCIKVKRFFDQIPDSLIKEAEKYGVPLVSVPYYHVYSNIISVINQNLIDQKISLQQFILRETEKFHQLYFNKEGIMKMLEEISRYTNSIVMITTISDFPLYYYVPLRQQEEFNKINKLHAQPLHNESQQDTEKNPSGNRSFYFNNTLLHFQTFLLPDSRHYLCIDHTKTNIDETTAVILKQIFSVIALELSSMQVQNRTFSQKNYFDSFFYMLTDKKKKSVEEIQLICDSYSFPYQLKRICVTFECLDKENRMFKSLYNGINHELIRLDYKYFLCNHDNRIVIFFLYSKQVSNAKALSFVNQAISQLMEALSDYHTFFRLGISRCHLSSSSIAKAYEESLQTLHLQTPLAEASLVNSYSVQYAYHILTQLSTYEISKIYTDTVKELVSYDQENKSELLLTLKTYLESSMNLTDTAQKLFIHRNTLTSRLSLVKKLLFCELSAVEDIFRLYLGICAWELIQTM